MFTKFFNCAFKSLPGHLKSSEVELCTITNIQKGGCVATTNQIALYKIKQEQLMRSAELKESKRQADLNWAENYRHNQMTEQAKAQELANDQLKWTTQLNETVRSNVARELETNRSNLAKESQLRADLLERKRSNRMNENLKWQERLETTRANKARERQNALQLEEDIRANRAREYENARSNVARETESQRSNMAREAENSYHNRIVEMQGNRSLAQKDYEQRLKLQEINDKSLANAQVYDARLKEMEEQNRHNKETERLGRTQQYEIERHNVVSENLQGTGILANTATSMYGTIGSILGKGLGWLSSANNNNAGTTTKRNGGSNNGKTDQEAWTQGWYQQQWEQDFYNRKR